MKFITLFLILFSFGCSQKGVGIVKILSAERYKSIAYETCELQGQYGDSSSRIVGMSSKNLENCDSYNAFIGKYAIVEYYYIFGECLFCKSGNFITSIKEK